MKKMKQISIFVVILSTISLTYGLSCNTCSWDSEGSPNSQPECEKLTANFSVECPNLEGRKTLCITLIVDKEVKKDLTRGCHFVPVSDFDHIPNCQDQVHDNYPAKYCMCDSDNCNRHEVVEESSEELECFECQWDSQNPIWSNFDCSKLDIPSTLSKNCTNSGPGMKTYCTKVNYENSASNSNGVIRSCGVKPVEEFTTGCSEQSSPSMKTTTCNCDSHGCNKDDSGSNINYSSTIFLPFFLLIKIYLY